jgi:hypothetical protein
LLLVLLDKLQVGKLSVAAVAQKQHLLAVDDDHVTVMFKLHSRVLQDEEREAARLVAGSEPPCGKSRTVA